MMAARAMADRPQGVYGRGTMGGYDSGYGHGQGNSMGRGVVAVMVRHVGEARTDDGD